MNQIQFHHLHVNRLAHPIYLVMIFLPVVVFVFLAVIIYSLFSKNSILEKKAYTTDSEQAVLSTTSEKAGSGPYMVTKP